MDREGHPSTSTGRQKQFHKPKVLVLVHSKFVQYKAGDKKNARWLR